MNTTPKVLLLQEIIPHYRVPIFEALGKRVDLTIAHTDAAFYQKNNEITAFRQVLLTKKAYGPFKFAKDNLFALAQTFDCVISLFDQFWVSFWRLAFQKSRTYKFIFWGIGVSVKRGFDANKHWDWLFFQLARRADALVFYSPYPIPKYQNGAGIAPEKMFVAHNTVQILESEDLSAKPKDSFVFIGTLYKDKQLDELISAFAVAQKAWKNPIYLHIIGDGTERTALAQQIHQLGLEKTVFLHGSIKDASLQKQYFARSYACVSPGQAGLSVLQSFAFGVPFVTKYKAISGGENLNIQHKTNGLLYEGGPDTLAAYLVEMTQQAAQTRTWGHNAYHHFRTQCTVARMVDGFEQAVQFVFKKR